MMKITLTFTITYQNENENLTNPEIFYEQRHCL